jgi:MFS family permease
MSTDTPNLTVTLSLTGRLLILAVGFLGWLFAGVHMSITQQVGQPAAIDLLERTGAVNAERYQSLTRLEKNSGPEQSTAAEMSPEDRAELHGWQTLVGQWFAWYQCAFLFGAATGGLCFGWLGDRIGRARGVAASILTYSVMAGACTLAQTPVQLLVLWFLACTGVGGMWPNGVALVSEAWSGWSRPMVAGVIGTSANIGLLLFATVAAQVPITPTAWRWALLVGAGPVVLGLAALLVLPESPRWLAARGAQAARPKATPDGQVFRPPLLWVTLTGIVLATIPMIGGWGSANWMVPWADREASAHNPFLKAHVGQARALTGIVGSLLGGWIGSVVGRRLSFFLVSLFSLLIAQYTFWFVRPTDASFLLWVAALGFFSGIYFGWMPLFLPELFPTRARSTGSGVSFNFGRIVTAVTIFITGATMALFDGDYAKVGRATSLIFVLGMVAICVAPDTSRKRLED